MAVQRRREVDRALPRDARDLVVRLRLRRQRAARQEVLRAAHRVGDRARRGLARRAHAHPQAHEPGGRGALHRGGVPVGVRQDQPRDAHPDGPRLEGRDHRRRHRVDEVRCRRPAARHQPRVRVLRRGAGHQPRDEPERDAHARRATRCSPTSRSPTTATCGGKGSPTSRPRTSPTGAARLDARRRRRRPRTRTPASPRRRRSAVDRARVGGPGGRADLGVPLRRPARDHRAARVRGVRLAARRVRRRHHGLGEDGRRGRRGRRPAPRPVRDAAVLRLPHGRLLRALADDGATDRRRQLPRSSASTGSARTPTASSCGPASARTPACSSGSSAGSTAPRGATRRSAAPDRGSLPTDGLDVAPRRIEACSRSTRTSGAPSCRSSPSTSRRSATACPRAADELDALEYASAEGRTFARGDPRVDRRRVRGRRVGAGGHRRCARRGMPVHDRRGHHRRSHRRRLLFNLAGDEGIGDFGLRSLFVAFIGVCVLLLLVGLLTRCCYGGRHSR